MKRKTPTSGSKRRHSPAQEPSDQPPPSLLVLGLGNPGRRYEQTRHNVGAMLLATLQDGPGEFGAWKNLDGASGSTGKIGDATIQIAQPNTYMNLSGRPAAAIARRHQLPLSRILVVHDDLDLAVGTGICIGTAVGREPVSLRWRRLPR